MTTRFGWIFAVLAILGWGFSLYATRTLRIELAECRRQRALAEEKPAFDELRIKMMFKDPKRTKALADVACKGGAIESIWLRFPLLTPEFPSSETHVTIKGAPSISTGTITPRWETWKNAELCKDPANAKYCGGTGK